MSLYVRVYNSFWTHRKTARLRAKLGDEALWLPIRLWAYAADNQPDGEFSDYTADEIALQINYTGDASSMLQALLQAGFMDPEPLRIHDWQQHNSYHATFADKAKAAAKARWEKERTKEKDIDIDKDKKGKEASIAPSMLQACVTPPKNPSGELRAAATLVLIHLNTAAGRCFQSKDETLKPIMRRLAEGCAPEDIMKMIDREIKIQGPHSKWLQTSTLFGKNFPGAFDDRNLPIVNGQKINGSTFQPTITQLKTQLQEIEEEFKKCTEEVIELGGHIKRVSKPGLEEKVKQLRLKRKEVKEKIQTA